VHVRVRVHDSQIAIQFLDLVFRIRSAMGPGRGAASQSGILKISTTPRAL
jgi:hypothetical protein